jgi:hypothetical protein
VGNWEYHYLKKISDFKAHIQLHRSRVVRLGMALAETQFPEINPQILQSFLKIHDYSKTLDSQPQLKSFGYAHERAPIERLFDFYGQTSKTTEQNRQLVEVIRDINSIDDQIGRQFLQPLRLDAGVLQSIYNIEKVADLVDRSLDPLAKEEFGHHMILASEYLQDPRMSSLSMWLEERYLQITDDLSFLSYQKAE